MSSWLTTNQITDATKRFPLGPVWAALTAEQKMQVSALVGSRWSAFLWVEGKEPGITTPGLPYRALDNALLGAYAIHMRYIAENNLSAASNPEVEPDPNVRLYDDLPDYSRNILFGGYVYTSVDRGAPPVPKPTSGGLVFEPVADVQEVATLPVYVVTYQVTALDPEQLGESGSVRSVTGNFHFYTPSLGARLDRLSFRVPLGATVDEAWFNNMDLARQFEADPEDPQKYSFTGDTFPLSGHVEVLLRLDVTSARAVEPPRGFTEEQLRQLLNPFAFHDFSGTIPVGFLPDEVSDLDGDAIGPLWATSSEFPSGGLSSGNIPIDSWVLGSGAPFVLEGEDSGDVTLQMPLKPPHRSIQGLWFRMYIGDPNVEGNEISRTFIPWGVVSSVEDAEQTEYSNTPIVMQRGSKFDVRLEVSQLADHIKISLNTDATTVPLETRMTIHAAVVQGAEGLPGIPGTGPGLTIDQANDLIETWAREGSTNRIPLTKLPDDIPLTLASGVTIIGDTTPDPIVIGANHLREYNTTSPADGIQSTDATDFIFQSLGTIGDGSEVVVFTPDLDDQNRERFVLQTTDTGEIVSVMPTILNRNERLVAVFGLDTHTYVLTRANLYRWPDLQLHDLTLVSALSGVSLGTQRWAVHILQDDTVALEMQARTADGREEGDTVAVLKLDVVSGVVSNLLTFTVPTEDRQADSRIQVRYDGFVEDTDGTLLVYLNGLTASVWPSGLYALSGRGENVNLELIDNFADHIQGLTPDLSRPVSILRAKNGYFSLTFISAGINRAYLDEWQMFALKPTGSDDPTTAALTAQSGLDLIDNTVYDWALQGNLDLIPPGKLPSSGSGRSGQGATVEVSNYRRVNLIGTHTVNGPVDAVRGAYIYGPDDVTITLPDDLPEGVTLETSEDGERQWLQILTLPPEGINCVIVDVSDTPTGEYFFTSSIPWMNTFGREIISLEGGFVYATAAGWGRGRIGLILRAGNIPIPNGLTFKWYFGVLGGGTPRTGVSEWARNDNLDRLPPSKLPLHAEVLKDWSIRDQQDSMDGVWQLSDARARVLRNGIIAGTITEVMCFYSMTGDGGAIGSGRIPLPLVFDWNNWAGSIYGRLVTATGAEFQLRLDISDSSVKVVLANEMVAGSKMRIEARQ